VRLIEDLERTRDETLGYFSLPDGNLTRTYGPGKWNVRYLLHHLVDSETVLYYRIRRVLCEPRQVIWYYDEAAWAKGLNYAEVPLDLMRPVYESTRAAIIYYAGLHFETSGESSSFTASPAFAHFETSSKRWRTITSTTCGRSEQRWPKRTATPCRRGIPHTPGRNPPTELPVFSDSRSFGSEAISGCREKHPPATEQYT
jgi:hypothetical protein